MLRKALLKAFLFLVLFCTFTFPAVAFEGGQGHSKNAPDDSQAPLSNGMTWFVRRVPVLLYNPVMVETADGGKLDITLKDADLVWGELWTKAGWAQESTRFGLNELYIPINPDMVPARAGQTGQVILPHADFDKEEVREYLKGALNFIPQFRVVDKTNTWAGDASTGVLVNVALPSREDFLAQEEGINEKQLEKWKPYLASKQYSDGLIPSADGSRYYLRALDAYDHGATFYYHLLLNAGPQEYNYIDAAEESPYYDENSPSGKGFYRGKDWSEQLEKSPGSVPGFIGAVRTWANLKLSGPAEVTGTPGEEKEVTFTLKNESSARPSVQVKTRREGEGYATVLEGVTAPAWGENTFTLRFTVAEQPYTVYVGVIDPNMLEDTYEDNYLAIVVKPEQALTPSDQGGSNGIGSTGGNGNGEEIVDNGGDGDDNYESGNDELHFYARTKGGHDKDGNYVAPEDRPVDTAKYADIIKAVLKPAPPKPPRGKLVSWEIVSAKLTYPKQNPDFWFGHPVEPVGTVTVNMDASDHEATVEFEENWSLAGAPIYDMKTDQMAPPPTEYTITATYTVHYVYKYKTEDGWEYRERTETKSVSGKLLVNGTGVNYL